MTKQERYIRNILSEMFRLFREHKMAVGCHLSRESSGLARDSRDIGLLLALRCLASARFSRRFLRSS